mmetsp:Transcript_12351/g.17154  ORF Transcript_12351/g.17154 Transcript_12351/m.17154 type:complete len:402 (-) Transcript_12351:35-1240(-)
MIMRLFGSHPLRLVALGALLLAISLLLYGHAHLFSVHANTWMINSSRNVHFDDSSRSSSMGRGSSNNGRGRSDRSKDLPSLSEIGNDIVAVPSRRITNGGGDSSQQPLNLEERVRLLELKLNSHLSWLRKPSFGSRRQATCKDVKLYGEQYVCLDHFPPKNRSCIVYDFGIRDQPEFGVEIARKHKCEVHAFDPSPVSLEWWESEKERLSEVPGYHFHPYGAGGINGNVKLYEYSWEQVANIRIPVSVSDKCTKEACELMEAEQKEFKLPVRTFESIKNELGHANKTIDIVKLDVEGSEWEFLQQLLDQGCPDIDQFTIEYHHYTFDNRYGGDASPEINLISTLLHVCGLKSYQLDYEMGGFPDGAKLYKDYGLQLYFNTISYAKHLKPWNENQKEEEETN